MNVSCRSVHRPNCSSGHHNPAQMYNGFWSNWLVLFSANQVRVPLTNHQFLYKPWAEKRSSAYERITLYIAFKRKRQNSTTNVDKKKKKKKLSTKRKERNPNAKTRKFRLENEIGSLLLVTHGTAASSWVQSPEDPSIQSHPFVSSLALQSLPTIHNGHPPLLSLLSLHLQQ